VGPDGPMDMRESFSQTTVDHSSAPVDGERPAMRGWQDKAARAGGSVASSQPAPVTEVARSGLSDTGGDRSQNDHPGSESKEHASIWMKPGVKFAIQRLAKNTGVSFSSACDTGLEVYARAKIRDQEETLFEPRMQAMMRREIRSSDNRHIYFEMRNAIAAEQTRIMTTDLYKRQLQKEGIPLKQIHKKLDDAYNMARDNILRKTKSPQLRNLLAAWWRATEEQAESRAVGDPDAGEAGNGNTHA
jgi:hypothetical protein